EEARVVTIVSHVIPRALLLQPVIALAASVRSWLDVHIVRTAGSPVVTGALTIVVLPRRAEALGELTRLEQLGVDGDAGGGGVVRRCGEDLPQPQLHRERLPMFGDGSVLQRLFKGEVALDQLALLAPEAHQSVGPLHEGRGAGVLGGAELVGGGA